MTKSIKYEVDNKKFFKINCSVKSLIFTDHKQKILPFISKMNYYQLTYQISESSVSGGVVEKTEMCER